MRIILIDMLRQMTNAWRKYFKDTDVEIVTENIEYYEDLKNIECVVSPANSYGLMDGGYDMALTRIYGDEMQRKVQDYIIRNYCREQPVGSSFLIDIPGSNQKLIHTPTMRIPSVIKDDMIVYTAMQSTLICALEHNVESILIPAFGGATGEVPYDILAKRMYEAYAQIFLNHTEVHSWNDVEDMDEDLNRG